METDLKSGIATTALAFRGYNVKNLGRSAELLRHPGYGSIVAAYLKDASQICSEVARRKVNLANRVRRGQETTLRSYSEAIALIVAIEMAQLELLNEFFDIDYRAARMSYGFSLGEITALAASGTISMREAIHIPLTMARDAVALASDVTMGIIFSRGPALDLQQIERLCLRINHEGRGVIGVSTYLSPNSLLVLGQQDTVDRFRTRMHDYLPAPIHLRKNQDRWPPLHTPIVWQRNIPNRARVMMHTMEGGFTVPVPNVVSMVTGKASYNDHNGRELIGQWIDHPQRLWDVVYGTLASDVETVLHVGPRPNLLPATFERISANVVAQVGGESLAGRSLRAVGRIAARSWLRNILPSNAALLRAPKIRHIVLEDWLLEQDVA